MNPDNPNFKWDRAIQYALLGFASGVFVTSWTVVIINWMFK